MHAEAEAEAAAPDTLPIERSGNAFKPLKDIEAIKKILPHRQMNVLSPQNCC